MQTKDPSYFSGCVLHVCEQACLCKHGRARFDLTRVLAARRGEARRLHVRWGAHHGALPNEERPEPAELVSKVFGNQEAPYQILAQRVPKTHEPGP